MSITTPPSITALPTPPDPNDRATFNTRAYPWAVAQATLASDVAAVSANVYSNALEAEINASITENAVSTVGVIAWVSGTTYAIGDVRYSPSDAQTYRRKTAGAGTTDPTTDTTNWTRVTFRSRASTPITKVTSSQTVTPPSGAIAVKIACTGGGGGGYWVNAYGGGGGGGGTAIKYMQLTGAESFVCAIGAGSGGNSSPGGNSTVTGSATLTGTGGTVGQSASYGGAGGTASGGDINMVGGAGTTGNGTSIIGMGGSSYYAGQNNYLLVGAPNTGQGGNSGNSGGSGIITFEWIY